jgi:cytochrome c556
MNLSLPILISVASISWAQTPDKIKKSEDDVRQEMIKISRQVGVTCTECHSTKNFKANEKPNFKIALAHMKMTEVLKQNGFSGKNGEVEASCYMCHRGQLKFDHKEHFNDHFRSEPKKKRPTEKEQVVDDKTDTD